MKATLEYIQSGASDNCEADVVQDAMDTGRNKFGIANAVMRKLREADRIIADGEYRVMAENKDLEEIMVVESDGTVNRYKRVV